MSDDATRKKLPYPEFLARLVEGEAQAKQDRSRERRVKLAKFPYLKTLNDFNWSWPTSVDQVLVKSLFRLDFLEKKENIIFLGGVGLGKTHLSIALGHRACLNGHSVLFTQAIDVVNTLVAAHSAHRLKQELRRYQSPDLLILDELGYLPIDKRGTDLLFQVVSSRYENGSIILTTNRPYKRWAEIFNNDATVTSALLDRLLHHATTVQLTGKSYRTNVSSTE
jgi:DNA replication protein DnaC